nr:MAG TPA: hypothetical protein [Caudoviricetes sp.]
MLILSLFYLLQEKNKKSSQDEGWLVFYNLDRYLQLLQV